MANHKSAIKRNIQNAKRRMRNRMVKTRIKTAVKSVQTAQQNGNDAAAELNAAQAIIDKAAKKGVIHKRTASRKISRLTRRINRMTAA